MKPMTFVRPLEVLRTFYIQAVVTIITLSIMILAGISTAGAVTRVGPVNPLNGYPLFYEDSNGLRLDLCDDLVNCFFAPPNPALPAEFPINWPDEAFYWAAEAVMDSGTTVVAQNTKAILVMAREAAFFDGPVVDGDQVVFSRIRFFIDGIPTMTGNTYRITYPYGTETFTSGEGDGGPGVKGPGLSTTRDVGITAPGEFSAATAILDPFLIPAAMDLNTLKSNPGSLLDTTGGLQNVPVKGSPFGTNFFRIEGPNIGDAFPQYMCADPALGGVKDANGNDIMNDCVETHLFSIMGRVTTKHGAQIDKATFDRIGPPAQQKSYISVSASSAENQTLTASVNGADMFEMTESAGGNYFVRLEEGTHYAAGATGPDTVTVRNLGDGPASFPQSAIVTDELLVAQAEYDMTSGAMHLNIQASDRLNTPVLNDLTGLSVAFYPAGAPLTLVSAVPGLEPGSLQVTYQNPNPAIPAAPPQYVEILSAQGWITGAEIMIIGNPLTIGPAMPIPPDQTRPLLRLQGGNPVTVAMGSVYNDAGATALDNNDGDLTASIQVSGLPVDTTAPASFTVTYSVADAAGNTSSTTRSVNVVDMVPPAITIMGDNPAILAVGATFVDPGAIAMDNVDGDLTANIGVFSSGNNAAPGIITFTYIVTDSAGNRTIANRTVNVVDQTPPVISIQGNTVVELVVGSLYTELGAIATDLVDGIRPVTIAGAVDPNTLGTYQVTYTAADLAGNMASAVRTVSVVTQ
ncbi:MAG: immunoglobulin-like domain-containing protein, partial [Nitrospinaceae bacterium]